VGLRGYLSVLRARWLIVVGCALIALIWAGTTAVRAPRIYIARSSVFFSVSVGQQSRDLTSGFGYAQGLVSSYAQLASQPVVLNPVIAELGLSTSAKDLSKSVSAQTPLDTVIMNISVSDTSPGRAALIANAVAQQLTLGELPGVTNKAAPLRVTVVAPAAVPDSPSSPRVGLDLTLALIGGGFLGIILAFVRDIMDARIGSRRDVSRVTDVPVIGTVASPRPDSRRRRWISRGRNLSEDRAKELRTNFQHIRVARRLHSVVFTSANNDLATTLTVISLGVELAHAGFRTILVDADLRKPSIASGHDEESAPGLSAVLLGEADWRDAIQQRGRLAVLSVGARQTDPSLLLQQPARISAVLTELVANYDVVLIKAPPVLRVADGLLLARIADGTVVVADGPAMNRNELAEEVHALGVADALVLGIVLMA
jgi:capsular exopolysaccharide synthesis family protein